MHILRDFIADKRMHQNGPKDLPLLPVSTNSYKHFMRLFQFPEMGNIVMVNTGLKK